MEHPARILFAFSILLVIGLMAAGCSNSPGSSETTPAETAASGPLFSEGDIVQMSSGSSTTGYLILGYDSGTDMYTRAIIHKNTNGAWGYRTNSATSTLSRAELEKVYSVADHVSVDSIPTSAPTVVTTTAKVTTRVTTAKVTTTTTSTVGKPQIKTIDPEEGKAGESLDMTITGANFKEDATVKLTKSGETSIDATDVSVDDSTEITCTFDIPSDTPASVGWSVVVTNPDGKSGELANYFTVHEGETTKPTVTSITPKSGYQGDSVEITLTGTGFDDDCTVELTKSGEDSISGDDVSASSKTKMTATFEIPSDAATGTWGIVVTNSDDESGKLSAIFTVRKSSS